MKAVELFAGAGGLAMGTAEAGFSHEAILEWNKWACSTIRTNQSLKVSPVVSWPSPYEGDVRQFDYSTIRTKVDLVAGGPPCQPFSIGGKHRASNDERDMFPEAARAVNELQPGAFIFENVRGLTRKSFESFFEYVRLLSLIHI